MPGPILVVTPDGKLRVCFDYQNLKSSAMRRFLNEEIIPNLRANLGNNIFPASDFDPKTAIEQFCLAAGGKFLPYMEIEDLKPEQVDAVIQRFSKIKGADGKPLVVQDERSLDPAARAPMVTFRSEIQKAVTPTGAGVPILHSRSTQNSELVGNLVIELGSREERKQFMGVLASALENAHAIYGFIRTGAIIPDPGNHNAVIVRIEGMEPSILNAITHKAITDMMYERTRMQAHIRLSSNGNRT